MVVDVGVVSVVALIIVVNDVDVMVVVVVDPRKLPVKFCQCQVSNSRDIAVVEFLVGSGVQSCFRVKPNLS